MSTPAVILQATHQADLDINGVTISCAVLNDANRTRVFSERSLATAFGIKGSGAYWKKKRDNESDSALLPEYLSAQYLEKFISNDLRQKFNSAYQYIAKNGSEASGVDATLLADICDVYITAYQAGNEQLKPVADKAYSVIKALSKVAIIALIDSATGFQDEKDYSKDTLQRFLKKFLTDEAAKWVKTFEDDFFEMIFRMKGWDWLDLSQKPGVVGHYINDLVYDRIAPEVLEELRAKNPKDASGKRSVKHHQYLSRDMGHPKLKSHLEALTALGRASRYNWHKFYGMVEDAYPKYGHTLKMQFPETFEDLEREQTKGLSNHNKLLKTALNYNPKEDNEK